MSALVSAPAPAQIDNWVRPFLRSMLSQKDGTGSSANFCVVLVVVFTLGFISALLFKVHGPISVAEFCQALGALTMFVVSLCGALYGIHRTASYFDNKAAKAPQPQ